MEKMRKTGEAKYYKAIPAENDVASIAIILGLMSLGAILSESIKFLMKNRDSNPENNDFKK